MSRYAADHRDECPTCHERYFAELGYEEEICSEREAIECQCGNTTFCQSCQDEEATSCAHPGCSVVFCSEACASGHDLDGEVYCAGHIPAPAIELILERFAVGRERVGSAAEAVRMGVSGI